MQITDGVVEVETFFSVTLAILVLFIGKDLNSRFRVLRDFNIPEPVTGGLLSSLVFAILYFAFDLQVNFELEVRDVLLAYFFTTIGINAKLRDLARGGRPLLILLVATMVFMGLQNATALSLATAFGDAGPIGLLAGTVSMVGGHGTAIAWAPTLAEQFGVEGAMELGVAAATCGLIMASLVGGPIAKYLIYKHDLEPKSDTVQDVGIPYDEPESKIDTFSFLNAILAIHVSAIIGIVLNEALAGIGFKLPLFVTCLFGGILLTNLIPVVLPRAPWPGGTTSMALIADVALGVFLAMSLMSMQLWTIADLAGRLLTVMVAQLALVTVLTIFVVFRLMGRDYDAAVVCSGFGGFALGSTVTAMANMTAVTRRYGPSHLAFIIVPLVGAFFIDIVNAVMIRFILSLYS